MLTTLQKTIIKTTEEQICEKFESEGSGHDWQHILRVWKTARQIHTKEGGNQFIIEMGVLLHDIADWKFYNGNMQIGPQKALEFLEQFDIPNSEKDAIVNIVANISFKGIAKKNEKLTLDGQIVQDADRLDAIGAVGIARVFAYSGYKNRPIYDPNKKPINHKDSESYFKNDNTAINHFYEKLLLLKDLMNTDYAKELAEKRHKFMLTYLEQFYSEVDI